MPRGGGCRARSAAADRLGVRRSHLTAFIWIVIGYATAEYALMVAQNIATAGINVFSIYRWPIWKRKA